MSIIENNGYLVDAPDANPLIRDRVNSVNALFAHDKIEINTDKCPNFVHALENQGYDKQGQPEKSDNHPADDDWNDNAGYFINRRFPITRPPADLQVTFSN